jgi:hypothetical protein
LKTSLLVLAFAIFAFASSRSINDYAKPTGKYLVVSKPILIASGDTLIVPQGREVLFTNLSGITILSGGAMSAIGTKGQPIYFTSLLDTAGSASAFDWNGIEIKSGAAAHFAYCFVAFSTSGITAEDSTGVQLENCIFSVNGQWNFSVSGIITPVPDLQPFSYRPLKPQGTLQVAPDTAAARLPVSPHKPRLRPRQLVLGGIGIVLIAAGSATLYQSGRYRSEYNAYVPGSTAFDAASPSARQNRFDDLRGKYGAFSAIGGVCIGLAAVDVLFLAITVRF